ncbi:MAG: hypothetical protein E7266_10825 [Lachnospiraceae bacterium]|nr:hypothetical protein [Lachnospiraceae bacterium]
MDIKPTKTLKKAIENYNLHKIFTGSLSQLSNIRYTRSTHFSDIKSLGKDLTKKNFVMIFNHYELGHSCWTVWETPYMDFNSIKEIYEKEKNKRIWDSRQVYYDDGNEIIALIIN